MTTTVTVGKRLIPLEQIALVERFDPIEHPRIQTYRPFKARVVLIDRESVLTEDTVVAFAEAHGFRRIADEEVASNPAIHFGVETFEPAAGFNPTKPYRSRLLWRDFDGNTQSKLMLSAPEVVLAIAVKGEAEAGSSPAGAEGEVGGATVPMGRRRRTRRREPAPEPT
jgi:hypothetical protein